MCAMGKNIVRRSSGMGYSGGNIQSFRLHNKLGVRFGLTTPGWFFFLLMAFIMAAAVSSGHNLLYLSVCLFFGSFITMGNAAVMNLRGLEVEREVPEYLFAGVAQPVGIRVKNKRRIM